MPFVDDEASYRGWVQLGEDGTFFREQQACDVVFRTGSSNQLILGNTTCASAPPMPAALYLHSNCVGVGGHPHDERVRLQVHGPASLEGCLMLAASGGGQNATIATTDEGINFAVGQGAPLLELSHAGGVTVAPLHCRGAASASAFNITSDRRLKADVRAASPVLAHRRVMRMRVVAFRYRTDAPAVRRTGLVAQQVRRLAPQMVADVGDHLTIDLSQLLCTAIAAIQYLSRRVASLHHWRRRRARVCVGLRRPALSP
jgi:hypothetical protein